MNKGIIITVMNGLLFLPMGVVPSMVSLTAITMVGMAVRGARMVVIIDITILGILLLILIKIIISNEGLNMIVASNKPMATIAASSNTIAMTIVIPVTNGLVVQPMGVVPSMVSLTAITMVGVAVRGGRMVVIIDITILGILLPTVIKIMIRNEEDRILVASNKPMATIMASINDIAMTIVILVT